TQLRYDLRKLKGHGLLQRVDRSYRYRLTDKGNRVCLLFVLFHQRVCGPLANALFDCSADPSIKPPTKLEAAYRRADQSLQRVIDLLAA
ncbi:MarR family transcriptional regulator, partial [Acidobacteria bacterium AH-259-O06]|nr:MarR family transcriptional regulator [Acidobacteria bacterium AH-259-O06]